MMRTRPIWKHLPLAGLAGLAFGLSSAPAADLTGPNTGPTINPERIRGPLPPERAKDDTPAPAPAPAPAAVAVWTSHDPAPAAPPSPATAAAPASAPADFAAPVNAQALKATTVTAHLREAHAKGKNLVWCLSFQLAWDIAHNLEGEPIKLAKAPVMAQVLDEHLASKDDIDAASYLAQAGLGRNGIVEAINKELKARFPNQAGALNALTGGKVEPSALIAFACIDKQLVFAQPFEINDERPLVFNDLPVQTFGLSELGPVAAQRKQVLVIDHKTNADFIIELQTQSAGDRLILAVVPPGKTLKDTVDGVLLRMKKGPAQPVPIAENEPFRAPVINFNLLREYSELEGAQLTGDEPDGTFIKQALQVTRFRLDHTGAKLESAALEKVADDLPPNAREFIVNRPFLAVLMRKTAKMPYLAVWIDNSELLAPQKAAESTKQKGAETNDPPEDKAMADEPAAAAPPPPVRHPLTSPAQRLR